MKLCGEPSDRWGPSDSPSPILACRLATCGTGHLVSVPFGPPSCEESGGALSQLRDRIA